MNFSMIKNLPVDDLRHVPEWNRVSMGTTVNATKPSGGPKTMKQYTVYEETDNGLDFVMIGTAADIEYELGMSKRSAGVAAARNVLVKKKYRIVENKE